MGPPLAAVPSGCIPLFQHGFLHGCSVAICFSMVLHGPQGNTCSTIISPTGCREISAAVMLTSSTSFFSDLGVHRVASHTFFLTLLCGVLPFLKHIFIEAPPAWLRGSAVGTVGSLQTHHYQHLETYTQYNYLLTNRSFAYIIPELSIPLSPKARP